MSVEGRISVDVVFHDTDGTNAINVLTLQSSQEYTTGSVAIVSGTCGTSAVGISLGLTTYRDAAGNLVSLNPQRAAFQASGNGAYLTQDNGPVVVFSQSGRVSVTDIDEQEFVRVSSIGGTVSYTIILYGT